MIRMTVILFTEGTGLPSMLVLPELLGTILTEIYNPENVLSIISTGMDRRANCLKLNVTERLEI
jgi:hypothetical protein